MQVSTDVKVLFVDTGFLTFLYNKERLNFNWDVFVESKNHPFDIVAAYVPSPDDKHSFIKYVTARNILTQRSGILMPEFLLQTHLRAVQDLAFNDKVRYDYTIIGHEQRLVKVLHPLLDVQQNDVITLHHSHERSEVQTWIDSAPKNVYWHGIDCMKKYFNEVK